MTNIMVMFIASISNGLTYTGAIVADNIFWLMPNFSCDFLQYFLNSFSTPTLSDRYVYNGYVFFCDSHSFIICRNSKCKQHFLTAYHHAFIDYQGITLTLEKGTRFLIDTKT